MASLCHFPTLGSQKTLFSYPFYHHSCNTIIPTYQKHYFPTISASSTNKTRSKRKVKSNAELCNDIREFISMVGLPEGHVPSMKELSQHGRQDLANIVRRRGYKLIKELLATSIESDEIGPDNKEVLIELHDVGGKSQLESIGEERKLEDMTEDVLLSDEVPIEQNHFESAKEIQTRFDIQNKVANFIKSGKLEDDVFDISLVVGADGGNSLCTSEDLPNDSNSIIKVGFNWGSGRRTPVTTLNGSISESKQVLLHAPENDSPRDVYFPNRGLSTADCDEVSDVEVALDFLLLNAKKNWSRNCSFDMNLPRPLIQITKREDETEVNRLKFIIHQKELELSRLKEEIEKEKLALSLLHTEVEKEISKAQKLVAEKDTELLAAEEILSELKEVQVQYIGNGETVQVAGSFNGWHHQITMDPQPSSSILDPIKSRNSRLWSTVLWLYPGTYEIKFVIDGKWRIDPQRETITTGSIQNNILRVDR